MVALGEGLAQVHDAGRIAARATAGLGPGDVILLHDADFYSSKGSHRRTAAALEIILAELDRAGNRYRPSCLTGLSERTMT